VGHVIDRCGALSISETPIESDNAIGLLCWNLRLLSLHGSYPISRPCCPILLFSISLVRPNLVGQSKRRVRLAPYVLDGDAPGQLGQRQPAKLAIDLEHAEVGDDLAGDPHSGERERTLLEDLAPAVLVGVVCHHDDLR
jgi:hypothetical protein